ncbi:MAG: ABC transporter, permease protein [Parcubacteria group bacterium GW2011_GWA2_46_39]|nr:MAG: ABC transporter, permease protein [Parcubacteria group bacterium GW2011_GWA2_46_39]
MVSTNLRANRLRSFLTMLGLIIGIGSVVLIISIGAGAQSLILQQVNSLGSDLVGVLPGASDETGPPAAVFGIQVKTLVNDDVKALLNDPRTYHIVAASGYAQGRGKVVYQNRSIDSGTYTGVEASYPDIEKLELKSGRFFTAEEDIGLARVVVLGSAMSEELFQGDDPVGQSIKIGRETFRVIGEAKERGTVAFTNQDNQVFIPLNTAQKIMLGWRHLSLIRARVDDAAAIDQTLEGIKQVLREKHKLDSDQEDDFSVRAAVQALDLLTQITDALKFFLAAIAALSLLVGGIGIMNIMLVAVTERFREIGLRKAVGARRRDILNQFLIETLIITGVASIIGILGGSTVSALIAAVAKSLGYAWSFIVSPTSIIVAVGVGGLIGLVFGFYPASRAAKLNPVDTLRYE